jgi:hypothetical protein
MRKALIVSPHFPPSDKVDMHRVRLSLPYWREFGWEPTVLAVDPESVEGTHDPLLLKTIPDNIDVQRVKAAPARWTRRIGLSALGIRALPSLYREGARILRRERPDLVFISTTMFHAMTLGRLWKRKSGVPYLLDMHDPWVNDFDQRQGVARPGLKHRAARRLHRVLEPWTMREVAGLVTVSEAYHIDLRRRYPWIPESHCLTLPFGASAQDYAVAREAGLENPFFARGDGLIHGVYAGCLGTAMRFACESICRALRAGLRESPELFRRLRLHFVGTDYAAGDRARETIRPIAAELGVAEFVQEQPHRVPYFSALNLLQQADFLLVPGSSDSGYTASKLAPYILARKPLLAVFHECSSVCRVLRETGAGDVVTFADVDDTEAIGARLQTAWTAMLRRLPCVPPTDWSAFEPYTAREMTRRMCGLFDRIVGGVPGQQDGDAVRAGHPSHEHSLLATASR